mgnify:CR=1 FL=1
MSGVAKKMRAFAENSSWIRKMFEEGARMKAEFGADKVFDFSIGNPDVPPPAKFYTVLRELAQNEQPGIHGYMPNAGYPETREAVAGYLSAEHRVSMSLNEVVMTCGAGGALNVVLKTLLDPGDEVIIIAPYFVEYLFYVSNHGGRSVTVSSHNDFSLDLQAIAGALSARTKCLILNSPNNPTGRVYDEGSVRGLGELLDRAGKEMGTTIYLISDEPYGKIVYDGKGVPSVFRAYGQSIICSSYSKELSIPGERIGYIAVNPTAEPLRDLVDGLVFCNRTLGFVNAPALMQRVIRHLQGVCVDVEAYRRRRDLLCDNLASFGYRFVKPEGAFYLFPETPIDDVAFVRALQEKNILTVPGRGFGAPGFFRIAYCVEEEVIERSLEGFRQVAERYRE